jgi:hypothetical protein
MCGRIVHRFYINQLVTDIDMNNHDQSGQNWEGVLNGCFSIVPNGTQYC